MIKSPSQVIPTIKRALTAHANFPLWEEPEVYFDRSNSDDTDTYYAEYDFEPVGLPLGSTIDIRDYAPALGAGDAERLFGIEVSDELYACDFQVEYIGGIELHLSSVQTNDPIIYDPKTNTVTYETTPRMDYKGIHPSSMIVSNPEIDFRLPSGMELTIKADRNAVIEFLTINPPETLDIEDLTVEPFTVEVD